MRKFNLGYFIKEGFVSIFSHGLMSFAAVCMIVACLIIMGSFSLLAINVDEQLSKLEEENEFLVYVDESFSQQQIQQLMERVRQVDNVAEVTFVSADEAKAKFLEGREHQGLYANLPDGVIRDRLSVHVADLERFTETVDAVRALPGVANYRAEGKVAEGFVTVRNAVTALAYVLVGILAAVSLFIISNTTRLAAFSRREEIAIMKMRRHRRLYPLALHCGGTDPGSDGRAGGLLSPVGGVCRRVQGADGERRRHPVRPAGLPGHLGPGAPGISAGRLRHRRAGLQLRHPQVPSRLIRL